MDGGGAGQPFAELVRRLPSALGSDRQASGTLCLYRDAEAPGWRTIICLSEMPAISDEHRTLAQNLLTIRQFGVPGAAAEVLNSLQAV
jgi:hypothetical protein